MESFRAEITPSLVRKGLGRECSRLMRAGRWMAVAFIALATLAPWRAEATDRVALVMVGEDYEKFQKSVIGVKRAAAIAEALQAKGFSVLFSANAPNARARAILLDFSQKANGADLALAFLVGHVAAAGDESYFLPVSAELHVATDLFSRAISVSSVARIAGKAKAGAVIVLMTTPNFEIEVPDVDPRPRYAAENPKSVATIFSASAKLPVSRIDAATKQATDAVIDLLQQPTPPLAVLVRAASADVGASFGAIPDANLAKPTPTSAAATDGPAGASLLQQARSEAEKAKAELQRAQSEASRAQAEAEKVKAEAQAQFAKEKDEGGHTIENAARGAATPSIDESQLGKRQRERIQERLKQMSLYTGPIDSIMGPLTREAIMGYQRSTGDAVTGYLTPEQFQVLLPGGKE